MQYPGFRSSGSNSVTISTGFLKWWPLLHPVLRVHTYLQTYQAVHIKDAQIFVC